MVLTQAVGFGLADYLGSLGLVNLQTEVLRRYQPLLAGLSQAPLERLVLLRKLQGFLQLAKRVTRFERGVRILAQPL